MANPIHEYLKARSAEAASEYNAKLATGTLPAPVVVAPVIVAPVEATTAQAVEKSAVVLKAAQLPSRKAMIQEHGVIFGIGGGANIDKDDERLRQRDMVVMAHDFCGSDKRTFKANHVDHVACKLVESAVGRPVLASGVVLKAGESIPENDEVVGFDTMADPTHWFVAVKPEDASLIEAAKRGEVSGFSWSGMVEKTPVSA